MATGLLDSDPFAEAYIPPNPSQYVIDDNIDFTSPLENQGSNIQEAQVDDEELERQRLRDNENRERNKKMQNKDQKEILKKEEKRAIAKDELKKWYAEREKQTLRRKELNQENERLLLEKRKTFPTSWKKVGSMIDGEDRKDVSRMKAVLLSKKHEN